VRGIVDRRPEISKSSSSSKLSSVAYTILHYLPSPNRQGTFASITRRELCTCGSSADVPLTICLLATDILFDCLGKQAVCWLLGLGVFKG